MPIAASLLHAIEPLINEDRLEYGSRNLRTILSPEKNDRSVSIKAPVSLMSRMKLE